MISGVGDLPVDGHIGSCTDVKGVVLVVFELVGIGVCLLTGCKDLPRL